jgi:hypothetical protein
MSIKTVMYGAMCFPSEYFLRDLKHLLNIHIYFANTENSSLVAYGSAVTYFLM